MAQKKRRKTGSHQAPRVTKGARKPKSPAKRFSAKALLTSLRTGAPSSLLAILGGLLIAFSFPDIEWWPLGWVALVPLLYAVEGRKGKQVFLLGLLTGTTANFVGFFWMVNMLTTFGHFPFWLSVPVVFLGSVYQGLAIAAAVALSVWASRRLKWHITFVLPIFYAVCEAFHPILFPWYLANGQYAFLHLIQICDLVGVSAVTFVVVMGNAALFQLALGIEQGALRSHWPAAAAFAAVLLLTLVYGHFRLDSVRAEEAAADKLKIAVVEPEIGIFEEQVKEFPKGENKMWILKWNTLRLHMTSQKLARENPDLIVWPESTYFPAISHYAQRHDALWMAAGAGGAVALTSRGKLRSMDDSGAYNAVHSRGEELTFLVGDECAAARIEEGRLVKEETHCEKDLNAVWIGCAEKPAVKDSPFDQCGALAAGDAGLIAARTAEGWVPLETGDERDLLALAGSGPGSFVAGGDGVIIAGNVLEGVTFRKETPGRRWVAADRRSGEVILVSSSGELASIPDVGELSLPESAPCTAKATVADAAVAGNGVLWLATDNGLLRKTAKGDTTVEPGHSFVSVACNRDHDCAALDDERGLFELHESGARKIASLPAGVRTLSKAAFTRHYWWIPPDAQRLYQSREELPESTDYPVAIIEDSDTSAADANAVQRGFAAPLLFGSTSGILVDAEHPNSLENTRYNSAFLIDEEGRVEGRYDKQYLLMFGEHMPWGKEFPILYDWIPEAGRFSKGPNAEPLKFKGHTLGILVCYEDIIAAHTNKIAADRPNVFINLTNDAWFGKTKEAYQHFVLALFRAVEHRLPLVRATTTGVSGWVSATGEIGYVTDLYDAETFVADVPMLEGGTFYGSAGRFFTPLLLLMSLMIILAAGKVFGKLRRRIST